MTKQGYQGPLEPIDECRWRIPVSYKQGMRVEGVLFADEPLLETIRQDQAPEQVANVAFLPGIQGASLAMPDIHWGYGFAIGGVAATDPEEEGVISPGGVGYDINCGVRIMRTGLKEDDLRPRIQPLADRLFKHIPAGVGKGGRFKFQGKKMRRLLTHGVQFLRDEGLATDSDVEHCEEKGRMIGAEPDALSRRAATRGEGQCGTLGAGNHSLEVQVVEEIIDPEAAKVMGLEKGGVAVLIHSGSRGLGYQVCDDALRSFRKAPEKYGLNLPDRQLSCAPVDSPEGSQYLAAMCGAANFAWANRQLLMWQAREAFEQCFEESWESLRMSLVYDVAHNIAKFERHTVDGREKELLVHRKGATRAFPAGHPEVAPMYRKIGQPVIIPGDMGTESWVLTGQPDAMEKSFGSSCHGAGRKMSRSAAIRSAKGRNIEKELREKNIHVRCRHWKGLAEEMSDAYKNVASVVDVVHRAKLAKKVARLRPVIVIKG
jgi:tRNA-splicing ligase RtcB